MAIDSGRTTPLRRDWTSVSPSTADSTEMAGVMMQSPKNSAVASTPSRTR